MREKLLVGLAKIHARHPWRMLAVTLLLTLLFAAAATQLKVTMRWSDLLPNQDPRTIQFNKIIDEFKTSTSLVVVVQGDEHRIKQFADELAPKILATVDEDQNNKIAAQVAKLEKKIAKAKIKGKDVSQLEKQMHELESKKDEKLFQRIDYKTEINFLRDHGLLLTKENDLKNVKDVFYDPNLSGLLTNINNSMEKEYVGQQESISSREKEDGAVMFLGGLESVVDLLSEYADSSQAPQADVDKAVDKLLFGEPYFLSYDSKALILNAVPNFTMMDTQKMVSGTNAAQAVLDTLLTRYPDIQAGLSGFLAIGRDEMVYSEKSLGYTSLIAVVAILLLLILAFRMLVAPFLALFTLLIGTIWAIGAAAIVVGQLNIMTQMMTVILFGLGIDFSIHIISGFSERRALGENIDTAMELTFLKSGKGVLTGALTTAFAFLTLVISHSRGMKEMGLVTGVGLLAILLATFLLLPSLLVLRERRIDRKRAAGKKEKQVQRDISFRFLGRFAEVLANRRTMTVTMVGIITIIMLWMAGRITFDYNYLNIEPKGLASIALQDTVTHKFDMSMDYAMVTAPTIEESRKLAQEYRGFSTVAMTEDISLYLPSQKQQNRRIPHIREIRSHIQNAVIKSRPRANDLELLRAQLDRLQMNIMEMQDMAFTGGQDKVDNKCKQIVGDPDNENSINKIAQLLEKLDDNTASTIWAEFQRTFAPQFKKSALRMCNTKGISFEDLPETILNRYSNDKRDQFLVTVFPAGNCWTDAKFLYQFVDDLESVTDRATGMPPVFRALVKVIGRDGRKAMFATLIIVFLLLWIDFGKAGYAVLAMIPLGLGIIWMVGLMYLTRQQFNVMNMMGLPMILGIGIDDGVHVIHRWISEGKKNIFTVFSSTGKAILLTSLTTMLAFGSLMFSIYRGFGQLGAALFVGVAACFLTTVLLLPGIMGFIQRRKSK